MQAAISRTIGRVPRAQVDVSLGPEEVAGAEVLVEGKGDQAQCWSRELGRGECRGLGAWCPLEGPRPCGRFTPEASSLEPSCLHPPLHPLPGQ